MLKIDDLVTELNKYEIPNKDEIISWFVNGDKNATLENWQFYQKCILGMLHLDEHFDNICCSYKEFNRLETLLTLKKSKIYDQNEIKELIDTFISSDSISKSYLLENNELINYIKLYASSNYSHYNGIEIDETKVRKIKTDIDYCNNVIEMLSSASENLKHGKKVDVNLFKRQKEIIFNVFMTKNKKIKLIDDKIKELNKQISRLTEIMTLEELNVKRKYINEVIDFLNTECVKNNNLLYERLINDLISLRDNHLQDITINHLITFENYLRSFINLNMEKNSNYLNNMKKDIISCAKIYKYFWDIKWSKDKNFMELCKTIRNAMAKADVSRDDKIDSSLRESKLSSDNEGFIQGASLNKEQISKGMEYLSQKYNDIMKISDIKEYVSECAKFMHDFIMIHPFTDGNGRTSRMILQVMLAKRNILIPSLFDSSYHRIQSMYQKLAIKNGLIFDYLDNFSTADNLTTYNNDYTYIINYVINRVRQFNYNLLPETTEKISASDTSIIDSKKSKDMVCNIVQEIENYKKEEKISNESSSYKNIR